MLNEYEQRMLKLLKEIRFSSYWTNALLAISLGILLLISCSALSTILKAVKNIP